MLSALKGRPVAAFSLISVSAKMEFVLLIFRCRVVYIYLLSNENAILQTEFFALFVIGTNIPQ